MNIKAEKIQIIEQFQQVNDVELIKAIKSLLTYGLKKQKAHKVYDIPMEHQLMVKERFDKVRANPERLVDWQKAKKALKTK